MGYLFITRNVEVGIESKLPLLFRVVILVILKYVPDPNYSNAHGLPSKLITPHQVYKRLGKTDLERQLAYRLFFSRRIDQSLIEELRLSTQKGMVIGSDALKEQLAELHGRRVDNLRIGRPKKKKGL